MDKASVIQHLRAWIEGFDPASGERLALDHPAQRADTLRVLFATIALLERPDLAPGAMTRGSAPAHNAGHPWSREDDLALASAFDAGATIAALATRLERTRGAITARLVKLGKIQPPAGLRLRGLSEASTNPAS